MFIVQGLSISLRMRELRGALPDMLEFETTSEALHINSTEQLENDVERSNKKRKTNPEIEPLIKRFKKNGFLTKQTPLAILNELRSGLNYDIILSDGPPHSPNFFASVEVDGIRFSGSGNTKKQAKQRTAEAALLTLCPSILTTLRNKVPTDEENGQTNSQSDNKDDSIHQKQQRLEKLVSKVISGESNPISVLNELIAGVQYVCLKEYCQSTHSPYLFAVEVEGETYKGTGSNKKLAKAAAARSYFLHKYGHLVQDIPLLSLSPTESTLSPVSVFNPLAAADIAELVVAQYNSIMKDITEYSRRKVLSGIVMTTTPDCSGGKVISLGTGTKCISGDHISVKGAVLNDSHAEIISRRGLLRFLYSQLSLHADPDEAANESIFVFNPETKGFTLKEDVRFHLYISTSPCGDARIFSPHDIMNVNDGSEDKHPNRQSRGQLRTKIESGEGTIPVKSSEAIQTWDGILQGERLRTMSCSDKIGKWNVVGLQGSLLSHFVEPIYLHSIIVGSFFSLTHLRRAFYSRIENTLEDLPPKFCLNKVHINTTTSPETRHTGKAPNHSVNWVLGDEEIEIVNAITGKTLLGNPSRVCKQRLFEMFCNLIKKGISSRTGLNYENVPDFYFDAKIAADDYRVQLQRKLWKFDLQYVAPHILRIMFAD